jgi:ferric-dicitrate binding protein FerR (iron transport regulator)
MVTRRALLPLGLVVISPPALAVRTRVGEVTALVGQAVALFSGQVPRPLAPAAPIMIEDLLSTGPEARLACRLERGMELRLGANASLRVDRAVLGGPRPGLALRSFGGPVLMEIPPAAAGASRPPVALVLPWAQVGVRGTRFFAGESDGRNAVFVARGRVEVSTPSGRAELGAGEGVDVGEGGLGPVVRWGEARIARALALVGAG